jgi:hypothetical protein
MEEIFAMWQPVLMRESEEKATLRCFLTELTVSLVPVDSIVLAQCVLERLKLEGRIIGWRSREFLTDYATPPEDLDAEVDKWRNAWVVEIEIENPSPGELVLKNESLFLADPRIGDTKAATPDADLPYLIVADFADEESRSAWLEGVNKLLPPGGLDATMVTLSGEELTVFQARLEVKAEHRRFIKKIEDQCSKHEGYTNFATRADEADEVYNAEGVD